MTLDDVQQSAAKAGLIVMGTVPNSGTLVLLGTGPGFWPVFSTSPERLDKQPDPVDRWSQRVVGGLAIQLKAQAIFPFGGPPYEPFIAWALASGRAFQSPVGMLVHGAVGMMVSYRGALQFSENIAVPAPEAASPCQNCVAQPCTSTCPVGALGAAHSYDVDLCHAYLDTEAGRDCMANGCAVRRACPVSDGAGRVSAQSNLHMKAFHRT
jgi:NAD-dependent dihydropyrimidine dehydrogenase PreA subunit